MRYVTISHGDTDGAWRPDEDDEPLSASDSSVEEVTLQHLEVLGGDGHDHGRVLAPLRLVDRNCVCEDKFVQLRAIVSNRAPVDVDQ